VERFLQKKLQKVAENLADWKKSRTFASASAKPLTGASVEKQPASPLFSCEMSGRAARRGKRDAVNASQEQVRNQIKNLNKWI